MLETVAICKNYTLYHDDIVGNYKIYKDKKILAHPTTIEDALIKFNMFTNNTSKHICDGCSNPDCNKCERYDYD